MALPRTLSIAAGSGVRAAAWSAGAPTGRGWGTGAGTTGGGWRPTTGAAAQPAPPTAAAQPAAAPAPAVPDRTPPAWNAIQRGHRAYVARDFDTAVAAYREAAMSTPPLPVAHYFVACAQRAKNQWAEGIESFRTASRLAGDSDPSLKAKALFGIAMTMEIMGQFPQARQAWLEYKTWCGANVSAQCFPATADGHVAAIDRLVELDRQYAAVRQRIAERAAQAGR